MPTAPSSTKQAATAPTTTSRKNWLYWSGAVLLLSLLLLSFGPSFSTPPRAVEDYLEGGKFIVINDGFGDLRIFVHEQQPVDTAHPREAVVMIHGVPSAGFLWRKMSPEIAKRTNLRTVAFDLPGMSLSDKPIDRPYTFSYFADMTARVVEALDLDKVHLVLHDISGPFGTEFAVKNPTKIASITFSNTLENVAQFHQPFPMMLFGWRGLREIMWQIFTNPIFSPLKYLIYKWRLSDNIDFESTQAYGFLLAFDNGKHPFFKIMKNFNLTEEYRDFLVSGLHKQDASHIAKQLVWSTRDVLPKSEGQAEFLHRHFPLEKETWIDGKHYIQEDRPIEFANAVSEFVNKHKVTELRNNHQKTTAATAHDEAKRTVIAEDVTKPDPTYLKRV